MSRTATQKLIDYCKSVEFSMLPKDAVESAKIQILDCLGVGLAGVRASGVAELMRINTAWGGREESMVLGHNISLPAPHAGQLNATIIHARDFDDGHPLALMHPGVISVATALAIAEQAGSVSGKDFLAAVAMGTDLICRLGMAIQTDGPRSVTGWHLTAIFGFPVSSAVAGHLLRLSPEKLNNALGIAYHQSAGNAQAIYDGAMTKRLGPGFAVKGGIISALLAVEGVTGASGWLEGNTGLYNQYFGRACDENVLLSGLGTHFEGTTVAVKRYPCCGIVHPFIDAALELVRKVEFEIEDIEEISVRHGEGVRPLIEPIATKREPKNVVDSQFSVPWGVATALVEGKVALEHFTKDGIGNEQIRNLSRMVVPVFDKGLTRLEGLEEGRVELKLTGGRSVEARCENNMNEGGERMDFAGCVEKFYECAAFSGLELPADNLARLVELVKNIEMLADVSELLKLLQPKNARDRKLIS